MGAPDHAPHLARRRAPVLRRPASRPAEGGRAPLNLRALNRALLARQLLLKRHRLPVVDALERLAGLQAQWEPSTYLGLRTRLDSFSDEDLRRAHEERTVVRATLMRATVHLVSTRDYLHFHPALVEMIRRKWIQYRGREIALPELEELAARLLNAAREPRSAAELQALLEPDDELNTRWFRVRHHVPLLRIAGDYVAAKAWLDRPYEDADVGLRHLVRRYFAAFGPATIADAAAWTGLQVGELRPALDSLDLVQVDTRLYDLPDAPRPDEDTRAPPRLLPRFDNLILSHTDRTRVIADEHRKRVIRAGEVNAVFLVDGFVAGRWTRLRGKLQLDPFGKLSTPDEEALREEATRLFGSA